MENLNSPKPPAGVGREGAALWRRVVESWDLDPRELAVLAEAARVRQLIAVLDAQVAAEGVTVAGQATVKAHPALVEARQQRLLLARLLGALDLPGDDEAPATAASQRARRAANARWSRLRAVD